MNEEKKCTCGTEDNCGSDCDCNHNEEMEFDTEETVEMLTITLEDDSELECYVIITFDLSEKSYIALLPEGTDEVLLYAYTEEEDGEIELDNIEDDEEFTAVAEAFYALTEEDDEYEEEDEEPIE